MSAVVTPDNRRRLRTWLREVSWRHVLGILLLVYAMFPIVFVVSASLNERGTLTASNRLFSSLSSVNFRRLFTDPAQPYGTWFGNSMIVSGVTGIGTVVLGGAAAYAFSRFRFRGRRNGLFALMLVQMFPQLLAYVAIFLLLLALGKVVPALGLNSLLALIMVYLGGALGTNTYLMYGFFNTIPRELDEAARIDGAGDGRIFLMIMRLAAPVLVVIGLLSFVSSLNDFVIASVLLTDPAQKTLAVGLYGFVSQQYAKAWGIFAAGAVIAGLPVVVLFQFLQKYIVSGLTGGAVKG